MPDVASASSTQYLRRADVAQSFDAVSRGRDAMVGHRTRKLIQRNRELLAQITRMRLEAKEQSREEWLQRAKAQAARIANRPVSNIPQKDRENDTLPC